MAKILKVVTWNINGSHNPVKHRRCLAYLKGKNVDVAFLQETHFTELETMWKRDWVGNIVHSSYSRKRNGVVILFKKHLNIDLLKLCKDHQG